MICKMVKRTIPELINFNDEELRLRRNPAARAWDLSWYEAIGKQTLQFSDRWLEEQPDEVVGASRAGCAKKLGIHPATLAAFYKRLPPGSFHVSEDDLLADRTDPEYRKEQQIAFLNSEFKAGHVKVPDQHVKVLSQHRVGGLAYSVAIVDELVRGGIVARLESGPPATASAPAFDFHRGPRVYCQSQYDPDD